MPALPPLSSFCCSPTAVLHAGFRITACAATPDQAAFVLSVPRRRPMDETQETLRTSAFPSTHVKDKWAKNLYIAGKSLKALPAASTQCRCFLVPPCGLRHRTVQPLRFVLMCRDADACLASMAFDSPARNTSTAPDSDAASCRCFLWPYSVLKSCLAPVCPVPL